MKAKPNERRATCHVGKTLIYIRRRNVSTYFPLNGMQSDICFDDKFIKRILTKRLIIHYTCMQALLKNKYFIQRC